MKCYAIKLNKEDINYIESFLNNIKDSYAFLDVSTENIIEIKNKFNELYSFISSKNKTFPIIVKRFNIINNDNNSLIIEYRNYYEENVYCKFEELKYEGI